MRGGDGLFEVEPVEKPLRTGIARAPSAAPLRSRVRSSTTRGKAVATDPGHRPAPAQSVAVRISI